MLKLVEQAQTFQNGNILVIHLIQHKSVTNVAEPKTGNTKIEV